MDGTQLLSGPLILASASPRRHELLRAAGIDCLVRPSHVPEIRQPGEPPLDYVIRLAREKNAAVEAAPSEFVLAADTTVLIDGEVLEKPADEDDARRMLRLLAGRRHIVATGICLRRGNWIRTAVEQTTVHMNSISADEIDSYIRTGEPMDKAGAYAIQGIASRWITRIEGCYFNVVGLPVARLWAELESCRE
jgi:septum formation protein